MCRCQYPVKSTLAALVNLLAPIKETKLTFIPGQPEERPDQKRSATLEFVKSRVDAFISLYEIAVRRR